MTDTPAPAPNPTPAPAGDTGGASWLTGVDADTAKFITDKTVKDLPGLAKGYAEAQRALSTRTFEVPKAEAAADWAKINAARGVPESADKYDLGELKDKINGEAAKPYLAMLHEAGVPNAAAQKILGAVLQQSEAAKAADHVKFVKTSEEQAERVKAKWGQDYDKNLDLARRGTAKLGEQLGGLSGDELQSIERAIGTEKLLNLGLLMGRHMVEAGFVMSDGQHKSMTKEAAVARREAIKRDPAFTNANDAKHAAIKAEWAQLGPIING